MDFQPSYAYTSGAEMNVSWVLIRGWANSTPQQVINNATETFSGGGGPGPGVVPDATFDCLSPSRTHAGVRNATFSCTNSSQSDTVDYYGAGTNPCISTNTTASNPAIFPLNWNWCSVCMIAKTDTANTSCLALFIMPPGAVV
jgi:hypothetical protein